MWSIQGCRNRTLIPYQTGKKDVLFDATQAKPTYPSARPIKEQGERESQRLWAKCNDALRRRDQDTATDEKTKVEDMQRSETAERGDREWQPNLFRKVRATPGEPEEGEDNLDWIINANM